MFSSIYSGVHFIGCNILATISTLVVFITGYLIWGFVKRQFGQRVAPDGRKAIIITGSTSGFGLFLAKHFHKLGFTIIGTYYNDLELGYKELQDISSKQDANKKDNLLHLVQLDISNKQSIQESRKKIDSFLDENQLELFCLINNAGIASDGPFQWIDTDSIAKCMETNFRGVLLFSRQFIFRIIKSKGRIVNVSSVLQSTPFMTTSVYGGTKSAIAHFSDALQFDIQGYGASCRCVIPGNLMASTNIIMSRIQHTQKAVSLLSDEEKAYYKRSINMSSKVFDNYAEQAAKANHLSQKDLKEIYGIDQEIQHVEEKPLAVIVISILAYLQGSVGTKGVEGTYVVNAFDNAVRLIDCPSRTYAGNFVFTNIFGPIMDFVPYQLMHHFLKFIVNQIS